MADPSTPWSAGQTNWRPDASPFTILIGPTPSDYVGCPGIEPDALRGVTERIAGEDGLFLRIGEGLGVAHLWFDPACQPWGSVLLPSPSDPIRQEMARWFGDWQNGKANRPSPEGIWLTQFRHRHLLGLLRAYDGDQAGASQQQLAAHLLNREMESLSAAAFADSAERKQIRRWLARARWLVAGGYRGLLQGQWAFA